MSKLKVVEGSNVVSITDASREIRLLEIETKKLDPTNKQLVIWAHHFVRLGQPLLAQRQLARISSGYYDMMIYKDLFSSLLAWSLIHTRAASQSEECKAEYEYYLIVKRSLESFDILSFPEKPAFYRFRREFERHAGALTRL